MSLTLVRTKISEAVDANEAADYATAITKLRSAQMLLAAIPTRSRQGESEVAFEQERVAALLTELTKQAAAGQSIQRTKFTICRVTD
jgi:hypothetical protein